MDDIEAHLTAGSAVAQTQPDVTEMTKRLQEQAAIYAQHALSPNTWRAYSTDWRLFVAWCQENGRILYPAGDKAVPVFMETIALYVTDLAHNRHLKPATIIRKLSSISVSYGLAGVVAHKQLVWCQQVRQVLAGIRRAAAEDGITTTKKKPLRTDALLKLSQAIGHDDEGKRDRAILLIMFAGAFRRSEIEGLLVSDVIEVDEGLEVRLRRSKSDQFGEGLTKGIPYGTKPATCPVRAWKAWASAYGAQEGVAFPGLTRHGGVRSGGKAITGRAVAEMVQRRVLDAGLAKDERDALKWGGHSLRRGFATEAYANDAQEREIMKQGGWKSTRVMRGYAEDGGVWKHNAAMKLGL